VGRADHGVLEPCVLEQLERLREVRAVIVTS
jgi:hypothetical protein